MKPLSKETIQAMDKVQAEVNQAVIDIHYKNKPLPTREDLLILKSQGFSRDVIYQLEAGNLGLFGVAFFGHKGKPSEHKKLETLWNLILTIF